MYEKELKKAAAQAAGAVVQNKMSAFCVRWGLPFGIGHAYLVHLAVLLWWLLDRSSKQRATAALVALTAQLLPSAALTLRLPPIRRFLLAMDELIRDGLFGGPVAA